jgi:hypothetical protein
MLTFEKYKEMDELYDGRITELHRMINYRKKFLEACNQDSSNDLVIRSLQLLADIDMDKRCFLSSTLEDPGAAEDIVNSWLDSANHKYEFKFDGEED